MGKANSLALACTETLGMNAAGGAHTNFARMHEMLNVNTPAMAGGLSDRVSTIKELIERAAKV